MASPESPYCITNNEMKGCTIILMCTIQLNAARMGNTTFIPFGHDSYDKIHNIYLLVEHIRQQKEEFFAVVEHMIPTKGRHALKRYNPAKPAKWGYKNQVLSGD